MIDQESLRAYRRRWESVAEVEMLEQQERSVAERWRQLNALVRMAAALELPLRRDEQLDDLVDERWRRLREIHLVRSGRPA